MSNEPDPKEEEFKKKMLELDFLYEDALDSDADMERSHEKMMKAVTDIAFLIYPHLKNMESHQLRQFGDKIDYLVGQITSELDRFATWVEYPDQFDADGRHLPYKPE